MSRVFAALSSNRAKPVIVSRIMHYRHHHIPGIIF
jgi:hypothetical protein